MTYVLFNPLSNGGNGGDGIGHVQASFPGSRLLDITALNSNEFFAGLSDGDQVILCGGDGTIHHLVNELEDPAALQVPVYIWKFGTGNDFWRDAPEKKQLEMVLLNDYIKNLPVATVDGRDIRFLNNCGYGMDGLVCELGEAKKQEKGGKISYAGVALKAIGYAYRRVHARVTVDGVTKEFDKVWLATTMNGKFIGGGMQLAPRQDRRSDTVQCVVWHKTPRLLALPLFVSVFPGWHIRLKSMFSVLEGREIRVEFDRPCAMNLDGEVISGVTGYTVRK